MDDEILQAIVKACRGSVESAAQEDIQELKMQLEILQRIVSQEERNENDQWTQRGFSTSYWFRAVHGRGTIGDSYTEAFHAVTKILDILRGEPLTITIQKIQRNSKGEIIGIDIYQGKESDLALNFNSKASQIEYDLKKSIDSFKIKQAADSAYINHYINFYKIAEEHISSKRSSSAKKGWRKKVNEGHIVEAFQRHMINMHNGISSEETSYSDSFTVPEVLILLYYSLGNTPWWKQGDIGYNQVKANNTKLASQESILRVSAKILQLFSQKKNFDLDEFKKMFTAEDLEKITDITKLTEEETQNLLDIIRKNNNFKDVKTYGTYKKRGMI